MISNVKRETFLSVLKTELMKIPNLPTVDMERIKNRGDKNEREGTFELILYNSRTCQKALGSKDANRA
jgi:hypothetical protein